MRNNMLLVVVISLLSTMTMADSISITVKPARGLSGTTSLTIHDEGYVTLLSYQSAVSISENRLDIKPKDIASLRQQTLDAIDAYLTQTDDGSLVAYSFTTAFSHTAKGITKSISSKRLNQEAVNVVKRLTTLAPDSGLQYVKGEI